MDDPKQTICPWCDTEIVWDPEIGPEETCPHCLNELTDYRGISIPLNVPHRAERLTGRPDDEADPDEWDEQEQVVWDGEEYGESEDLLAYEEGVERQIDKQDEQMECVACQERMVYAGDETVRSADFRSVELAGRGGELLPGPYRMKLFVCPCCFRTERLLGDGEREAWMARFSRK